MASYAGHNDWRLPSEDGRNTSPTTNPRELETILLDPCGTRPCINSIFGPSQSEFPATYWSSTTDATGSTRAWAVYFFDGEVGTGDKPGFSWVRAVRDAS
jgi:hypothetical protein